MFETSNRGLRSSLGVALAFAVCTAACSKGPDSRSARSAQGATVAAATSTVVQTAGVGAQDTSKRSSGQGDTLSLDPKTNTVMFKLVAGPFNFNGYTSGAAALTVPAKSNVVINFTQDDGTPHSAEISSGQGPLPNTGGDPAIPKAYTNKVVEGLPQGATDVMRFTAPESGTFRIICGVPGHAVSGMWIWFKVDPAAKQPGFGPAKK
jgi:hypothetical protein